jgi:nicotinamidase-related amidase
MRSEDTALLLVDPYNDFLSEGGKVWPALEAAAKEVGLLDNLRAVVAAAGSELTRAEGRVGSEVLSFRGQFPVV